MSVIIKDMEMPKNCGECPLRSEVIMPLRCKGVYGEPPIYTTEELPNEKALMSKRHSMCPLIEVPKHGRLIDADALIDNLPTWRHNHDADEMLAECMDAIGIAPTIIEAEAESTQHNDSNALDALESEGENGSL